MYVNRRAFEVAARHEDFAPSEAFAGSVAPGEDVTGVTFMLRRGGRLTGQVLDPDGHPGAAWWIKASSKDWTIGDPAVQADDAGLFSIEHMAAGTYTVNAVQHEHQQPGPRPVREVVTITDGETSHVVLGGVREQEIRVLGTVTLRGKPVAGSLVWGLNEGAQSFSSGNKLETDERGPTHGYSPTRRRYGPLPPGTYRVVGQTEDGREVEGRVEVVARREQELVLEIE